MTFQEVAFTTENQHFATRRHTRQASYHRLSVARDIACEITRNPEYLRQYYSLREKVYTATWDLTDFDGREDDFDRRGHIVTACVDQEVVGGVRLNIRWPSERNKLPSEHEGFDLDRVLSEQGLGGRIGGEISRFALHPSYWGGDCSVSLLRSLYSFAAKQGLDYAICISPLAQARNYYRMARKIPAVREYRILGDAGNRSDYEGIGMVMSLLKLGR